MSEGKIEKVLELLADTGSALEALGVQIKHEAAEIAGVLQWDHSKIKWEKAEGTRGPYERSEDVNNLEFKSMLKDLAAHDGKITREGYFYWVFQNGSTVGRKKRK